jgi:hypothetical protein|tara:strand:- start:242 stop:1030 length:789 start_codon:yes stop_codon:yes gene_type:complete
MRRKHISIFTLIFLNIIAGCSSPHSSGQKPLRIETYPVDAHCSIKGDGFNMQASAPADIVVPISAAPFEIKCETESGYKGAETLSTIPNPWSPLNIGLGLFKNSAISKDRLPEFVQVTLIYTEAGITEKLDKPANKVNQTDVLKNQIQKTVVNKSAGTISAPKPSITESNKEKLTSSSAWRLHLSSFKKLANAEKSYKTLWQRHNKILKGLSASIEAVDLGPKGRFHRIYAGHLSSYGAARSLCSALKNKRTYCRPVAVGAK